MEAKTYKIMLVEDEEIIRENIKKSILWEKYGYDFCGEASNGEQALDSIEEIMPDVVITDICMPHMDGIELSRAVKALFPDIKILILSGHMEFSYAKEAVGIGVYEYLLKPITPMKLIRSLLKLKEDLDKEHQEKNIIRTLMDEIKEIEERSSKDSMVLRAKDLRNEQAKEKKLLEFLRFGHRESIDDFIDEYLSEKNMFINSAAYCSYFGIKIVTTCIRVIEEYGGRAERVFSELTNVNEYISKFRDIEQVKNETRNLISAVIDFREKTADLSTSIIKEAKEYIWENMGDSNLSLDHIARHVGLSPNYFSSVFKKMTGETFIKNVTKTRIEQAKKLLETTSMTTAEIAGHVGYGDPNYFISVFKRYTGKTTKEYRQNK